MFETLLCFPVSNSEKERLLKVCQALGITQPEFFRRSLLEAEITAAMRGYTENGQNSGDSGTPRKKDSE